MPFSLASFVRASSVAVLALAPSACSSSSSSGPSVDAPSCGAAGTIVLDGTIEGKAVSQSLATTSYFLDQFSDPKSVKVGFAGGKMNLGWASLVADGSSTSLTSGVLQLPGETGDRVANSGVMYIGTDEVRASLTFSNGKVGVCVKSNH